MSLRTRTRDPEVQSLRVVGSQILTRTNSITPSRNKQIVSEVKAATTPSGLRAEITTDETHGRPPYRTGGPFCSVKLYYPDFVTPGHLIRGKNITQPNSTTGAFAPGDVWTRDYSGGLGLSQGWAYMSTALPTETSALSAAKSSESVRYPDDLGSLGPTGWSKLRPRVEKAGLAQAVIELREAPQMLKGTAMAAKRAWDGVTSAQGALAGLRRFDFATRNGGGGNTVNRRMLRYARHHARDLRKVPRYISEEFLNYQFGWRPFVKDVTSLLDVVINVEDHIADTTRRNNAWMKRTWTEDVVESLQLVHSEGGLASSRITPIQTGDWWQPWTTNYMVYRESITEVWYEGVFKYYRPEFDADLESGYPAVRKARQILSILGGNVTPTVLYRVTPWTWLADWFANLGDNLQMLEDQLSGQVAAKYMYIMHHNTEQYRYISSSQAYNGTFVAVEAYRRLEVKRRVQSAGAFSFALRSGSLTGRQLAILGALGLTRT